MILNNQGKIYGVSLGPGDPDLLTIKGLRILQAADKIFYPGSLLESGKTTSYSLKMLQHFYLDETKLEGFFLTMNGDIEEADAVYEAAFQKMLEHYQRGETIAFVSEGDISFYSTFAYILDKIQQAKLEVEIIPGVPAFIAGGAAGKFPVALRNDKLAVLPRLNDVTLLDKYLEEFDTVVLMKFRSVAHKLLNTLKRTPHRIHYCERLGTEHQYITTDINELETREIPYFSLLIIQKTTKKYS